MRQLIRSIRNRLVNLNYRRNYYLNRIFPRSVPATPLHYLPAGFTVHTVARTGLRVVDNFCTREEALYLIEKGRMQLKKSPVSDDGRATAYQGQTSSHAVVFDGDHQDDRVLSIVARGAMLAGVPISHAEPVFIRRYTNGERYLGHYDLADNFLTDHRLCTILVYLNDLSTEQGGATYFKDLNIAVRPMTGRAVIWTNMNPDGTTHMETVHAALPPQGDDAEKWVIQLWFRPYQMHPVRNSLKKLQTRQGKPLTETDALPPGTWLPSGSGANAG